MDRLLAVLIVLMPLACASKEPAPELDPDEQAQLREIILKRINQVPGQVKLSAVQRESVGPFVKKAVEEYFQAARKYHADRNAKTLRVLDQRLREIHQELRESIKPLMTSAQLYNFLGAMDKAAQDVRAARIVVGEG